MGKFVDLTGKRFGRLVVVGLVDSADGRSEKRWLCVCDCGEHRIHTSYRLTKGIVKSCGCRKKDGLRTIHGMVGTRIYGIWKGMNKRCKNPQTVGYENYGGRGIKVCPEWEHDFQAFYDWSMANGYRDDLTIDRKDVNGDYCPGNCTWATRKQQANNTRANHYERIGDKVMTLAQWADEMNISYKVVRERMNKLGWSAEKALTTPVRKR